MYNNSLVYGPKAIFIFNMKDLGPSANGCDNFIIYGILVIYGYLEKKIFAKEPEWVSRGISFDINCIFLRIISKWHPKCVRIFFLLYIIYYHYNYLWCHYILQLRQLFCECRTCSHSLEENNVKHTIYSQPPNLE